MEISRLSFDADFNKDLKTLLQKYPDIAKQKGYDLSEINAPEFLRAENFEKIKNKAAGHGSTGVQLIQQLEKMLSFSSFFFVCVPNWYYYVPKKTLKQSVFLYNYVLQGKIQTPPPLPEKLFVPDFCVS